jgi:hypothetical protein
VTTLETTTSGSSTETTATSDTTQSPTSTEGETGVAPAVRRDDPPLTLSRGYYADLDTLNRDWDVVYAGTSFRYDLSFTLGGAGQLFSDGESSFAVVSGPVRYDTCRDATGYTSTLYSDEVRPDVALCVRTSEDRYAFVRILEVIEPNHKAVKLAVTVWETA